MRRQPGGKDGEHSLRLWLVREAFPGETRDGRGRAPPPGAHLLVGKLDERGGDRGASRDGGRERPQLAVEMFAKQRWQHRHRMKRVAQHMDERRPRQGAEIGRRSLGQGGLEMMTANCLILAMPCPEILDEAAERGVGGDAAV